MMWLLMVEHTLKRAVGICFDVIAKVSNFIILADFEILNCEVDVEMSIILGIKFGVNGEEATFNIQKLIKKPTNMRVALVIDFINYLGGYALDIMMNSD